MNIREILHRLVHETAGGMPRVLEALNYGRKTQMSTQMLTNKLNPFSESHTVNVQELALIADTLNLNLHLARHFAEKANAVVFVLPDVTENDMALLDGFMQITKELGDVGMRFQQAYADGEIDKRDAKILKKETDDAVAALLAFQKRIEGMVR